MNIIEEITERYAQNLANDLNSPAGKYVYNRESGVILVDGSRIIINQKVTGGAISVTDPFRIVLNLDKPYKIRLNVYPIDLWNEFLDFLVPIRRRFIPDPLRKQFWFSGTKQLLKQFTANQLFTENIMNERIYINTVGMPTNRIVLTHEYGIWDFNQFVKFVAILKQIETGIKSECAS